jgi:hypothetical protein
MWGHYFFIVRRRVHKMAACLDVEAWRISTPDEMLAFLGDGQTRGDKRTRHLLSVRSHLRPVDVYAYLKARFGEASVACC